MNHTHSVNRLKQSTRIIIAVITMFVIAAMAFVTKTQADTQQIVIEESAFAWMSTSGRSVVNDTTASGGNAVKLTKNNTGTLTSDTDKLTNIKITAKGDQCNAAPIMQVKLNGTVVATHTVSATNWTEYSVPVNAAAGQQQIQISFTNEYTSWWFFTAVCVRALQIDKVTLTKENAPAPTPTPSQTPTPTPSPSPAPLPEGSEYVAMGDSYSSGWGADRTPANLTINKSVYDKYGYNCGRSDKAAQVLIMNALKLSLKNVACGGANTNHIVSESYQGEPPQANNLTTNTKLVTMTIGGNDTALMYMLSVCVQSGNCWKGANWMADSYINQFNTKVAALGPKMEKVLRTVAQKAPHAKIRPAGYPYIIAAPGEPTGTCSSWLTWQEQEFFADATIRTNNVIKNAAEKIALETGSDIKYVDPLAPGSPFLERDDGQMLDGCSTSLKRYMNGTNDGSLQYGGWHPNIDGQRRYADLYKASF